MESLTGQHVAADAGQGSACIVQFFGTKTRLQVDGHWWDTAK